MDIQAVPDTLPPTPSSTGATDPNSDAPAVVRGADVLVVIPVFNEEKHIEACLASLLNGGDKRIADADVVVVDGASTDRTRIILDGLRAKYPKLSVVDNPERLQSAGVNRAAKLMGGYKRIMVRCDAHAVYPENYVMLVADSLARRKEFASVATPMDAVGTTCFQRANAYIVDTPLGSGGSAHRGGAKSMDVDHCNHAGFDMAAFLNNGGYDANFSHNEDGEYDHRLRAAGGRIWLDAEIRVRYSPRSTVQSLAKQYFNYGKGRARNLMKHGGVPKLRQLIPQATLVLCLLGFALAPIEPWTLVAPAGYVGTLALVSVAVAVHMRSFCGLMAGLASGTMHMSWAAGFFRQWLTRSADNDRKTKHPPLEPKLPTHAE
jgi:succinoglycan biosynthesis protein ExoA